MAFVKMKEKKGRACSKLVASKDLIAVSIYFTSLLPLCPSHFYLSPSLYIFNVSHKAHYHYVPAAVAVTLS